MNLPDSRTMGLVNRALVSGQPDDLLSWHPDRQGYDRAGLTAMVIHVMGAVQADPRPRWLVADENAAHFLAGLLGVLAAGRTAVLPQHMGREAVRGHLGPELGLVSAAADLAADSDVVIQAPDSAQSEQEIPLLDRQARLELFTSGSTGEPKRVLKSLAQLDDELQALEALWGESMGEAAVVSTVPHYHLYGLLFRLLWPWVTGRLFPEEALLEPPRIAQAVGRFPRAVLVSSPAHLKRWPGYTSLAHAEGTLPMIFSSAGPLPQATSLALHEALDPVQVWEVYGSTETGGIAYRDQGCAQHRRWHCFAEVELAFPDGEPGPMSVSSPATDYQWLQTGDRGAWVNKKDACFELLGRSDGVIKIEDRRISLAEIESALEASDWVAEAAVIRLDGERQTTAAAVVLSEAGRSALSEAGRWAFGRALRGLLATRVTEVALPRRFRYLDALPRNAMGKLQRRDLLALFEEGGP